MAMETKVKETKETISGNWAWASSGGSPTKVVKPWQQRTTSQDSIWPWISSNWNDPKWPKYIRDFWHRQDWGNAFITEKGSISSSLNSLNLSGQVLAGPWSVNSTGPVLLAGFSDPMALASSQEITDENAVMFGLGGTAISRTRPGKPVVDLAVTIGELRVGGIPSMIGSLFARSKSLRDVFRNSGNEYLNIQFGWAPLIRDLEALSLAVSDTRKLLEAHEKQLDKLLTRNYHFNDTIDTSSGLSKAPFGMANYELLPATPYGSMTSNVSNRQTIVAPVEITRKVTKSYFRAGYRFYYPDIQTALKELQQFEANANLLLGTRLDPEVLWNLQPWTWLIDWFVNFGDVIGNLSAIISDGLVIQYAYIMREVRIDKEIYFPRGVHGRNNNTFLSATPPYSVHLSYHRKMRAKASPFGFGLSPEAFTPQQWAILAALGISRGLK